MLIKKKKTREDFSKKVIKKPYYLKRELFNTRKKSKVQLRIKHFILREFSTSIENCFPSYFWFHPGLQELLGLTLL